MIHADKLHRAAVHLMMNEPEATAKPNGKAKAAPDLTGFLPNDYGNAGRFLALHGPEVRYSHAFRKWMYWDGKRWAVDQTGQVWKLAKYAMVEALNQVVRRNLGKEAERFAMRSLDDKRIASLLSMAQCEVPITPAELDTNAHLLNCANGTIDLRSGELRAHQPQDFITKLVESDYRPDAGCPLFMRFLERIMGGGPDAGEGALDRAGRLIRYLQVAFGYSLTGLTSEKVVFLCHGPKGNNGKTTLLSTIRRVLGNDYSTLLQVDTLMAHQESNNSQADLADLRGARFVMTSETEEGQRLAEGKIKRITQGMGRIKAVRKYENPIEFDETHKLWMDANHKPVIRGTDNAIWNRLHLIPFQVVIPEDEIDRELGDKLLAGREGILAWAVEGARRWYKAGLGKPPEVAQASRAWRSECDAIGRFIEERCVQGEYATGKARELYSGYKAWAEAVGEHPIRENDFAGQMIERGFEKKHTEKGAVYQGIGLKADG